MGLDRCCYNELIVCLLTIVTWAIFYCQPLILLTLQLTLLERYCELLTLLAMTVTLTGGGTVIDDGNDDGQTDSVDNDVELLTLLAMTVTPSRRLKLSLR